MIPNELGRKAGMTKTDGKQLAAQRIKLRDAIELADAIKEETGKACEADEDCRMLLETANRIANRFFQADPDTDPN